MTQQFPEIVINGDQIDAKKCIEEGTSFAKFLATIAAVFSTIIFIVVTYGGFLIVLLFYPIIAAIMRKKHSPWFMVPVFM